MCRVIGMSDSLRGTRSCEDFMANIADIDSESNIELSRGPFITSDTCFHSYLLVGCSECAGDCRPPY